MKAIEVKQLTKRFGTFTAVDHISFEVEPGEIFGFLGANGAGKTTAMRMLCGLSAPTSGEARVAGFDVYRESESIKRNIGYMSQKFSLYGDLKVWENIRLFGGIYGLSKRQLSQKTDELLDILGLEKKKTEMLGTVYRMLVLTLGEPVSTFTWSLKGGEAKEYTPVSFYKEFLGNDLTNNYVMLMNDPSREFYKCYEIDFDRHRYDGKNWTYVNLPIEDIKEIAIASIKDSTMMYFSCDVGKFLDSKRGLLDPDNYDYESLMGTTFGMDKKQRIQTFSSGSSHAMTLMAVDLDKAGKPKKWMVENSWGSASGYRGHLIMTDKWFDEYMFRVVAEKKYVPAKVLDILKQKPIRLPAWDPIFARSVSHFVFTSARIVFSSSAAFSTAVTASFNVFCTNALSVTFTVSTDRCEILF